MLAIFDLDGTLVDSRQNITNAVNYVRSKSLLPPLEPNYVGSLINRVDINPAQVFYGTDIYELWHIDAFTEYYLAHANSGIEFYDGVKDALYELKDMGFEFGVATNGATKFAETILSNLGVDAMFSMILGADAVTNPKPSPDMLHKIIDHTKKERVVFVGDSVKDKDAAKAANAKFAFAKYGFGPYSIDGDLILHKSNELGKIASLV